MCQKRMQLIFTIHSNNSLLLTLQQQHVNAYLCLHDIGMSPDSWRTVEPALWCRPAPCSQFVSPTSSSVECLADHATSTVLLHLDYPVIKWMIKLL